MQNQYIINNKRKTYKISRYSSLAFASAENYFVFARLTNPLSIHLHGSDIYEPEATHSLPNGYYVPSHHFALRLRFTLCVCVTAPVFFRVFVSTQREK